MYRTAAPGFCCFSWCPKIPFLAWDKSTEVEVRSKDISMVFFPPFPWRVGKEWPSSHSPTTPLRSSRTEIKVLKGLVCAVRERESGKDKMETRTLHWGRETEQPSMREKQKEKTAEQRNSISWILSMGFPCVW